MQTKRTYLAVAAIALVMGLVGSLLGTASAAPWSDLTNPAGKNYRGALATTDAGCLGPVTGQFRPNQTVRKSTLANALAACGSRVGTAQASANDPADGANVTSTLPFAAGGTGGRTGYVLAFGQASMSGDETADCPCRLTIEVRNVETNTTVGTVTNVIGPDEDCIVGLTCGTVSTTGLFDATGSTNGNTFSANARLSTVGDNTGYTVTSRITALYVPFGPDPSNILP